MDNVEDSFYADRAERLVALLCEIDLARWREAARVGGAKAVSANAEGLLSAVSNSVDALRLWRTLDTLETAGYRLSRPEALSIIQTVAERNSVLQVTRLAVVALFSPGLLDPEELRALTDPFLALIPQTVE